MKGRAADICTGKVDRDQFIDEFSFGEVREKFDFECGATAFGVSGARAAVFGGGVGGTAGGCGGISIWELRVFGDVVFKPFRRRGGGIHNESRIQNRLKRRYIRREWGS